MSDSLKYAEEKRVFHSFQKAFTDFPKGRIIKSESPDFILKTGPKKVIGIELVQLILDETENLFEKISYLLHKKEEKLRIYQKKRLNSYWLIIYIDSLDELIAFNLSNKISALQFESAFDRVFLYEIKKGKINCLSSPF